MVAIIYKFTILSIVKYFNKKPFYVGQHYDVSNDLFLSHKNRYIGSGKSWLKRIDELKRKRPNNWRQFIKREILYSSENISQKGLDTLEKYFIKKEKSHYSNRNGGCNILIGTANKFGAMNPSKDAGVKKRQAISLKKWWINHPEAKIELSRRRKNSKTPLCVKRKISESLKGKMSGKNNPMFGKRVSEETKKKMSIAQSKRKHRKPHTDKAKMLISISRRKYVGDKHPLYGVHYMWINNGIVNKRFNGNEIPEGWNRGRTR